MNRWRVWASVLVLGFALTGARVAAELARLVTVPAIDIDRYAGVWYEIARYPNWFERQCIDAVTATYQRLPDGNISVVNACRTKDGSRDEARGVARPATANDFTRLKVRFVPAFLAFLPFVWGDYWVIDLAADYDYAMIGEPSREYLWILARSPRMDEGLLQRLLKRAAAQGYDPARVIRTAQSVF